jgi:hypothetical protein
MIDKSQSIFYLAWAGMCAALGVLYVKVKSTEGLTITTKEFKGFQMNFLTAYGLMSLGETIASASFYVTLQDCDVGLETITEMYVVTVASSTFFNMVLDIVDIGTRKNKCILSGILFAVSMFSLYFRGHEGLYFLGRVAYGCANSLLINTFNSYLMQQHTTMGFPEDWLVHTFSVLTHTMAAVVASSGFIGQTAAGTGTFGCVTLSMSIFIGTSMFMMSTWEGDFQGPRFMLSNFTFTMRETLKALADSQAATLCVLLGGLAEGAILVILFYWAPWLRGTMKEAYGDDSGIPDILVYSSYLVASMIGTYTAQAYANDVGEDMVLQTALVIASICFFLGATVGTPMLVFTTSIGANLCIGAYWVLINIFRNKYLPHDWRDGCTNLSRLIAAGLCITILMGIHHSVMATLMSCSLLMAGAAYVHFRTSQFDSPYQNDDDD